MATRPAARQPSCVVTKIMGSMSSIAGKAIGYEMFTIYNDSPHPRDGGTRLFMIDFDPKNEKPDWMRLQEHVNGNWGHVIRAVDSPECNAANTITSDQIDRCNARLKNFALAMTGCTVSPALPSTIEK